MLFFVKAILYSPNGRRFVGKDIITGQFVEDKGRSLTQPSLVNEFNEKLIMLVLIYVHKLFLTDISS